MDVSRGRTFQGTFYTRGICQKSYANFFISLIFSLPTQFYAWRCSGAIAWGKFSPGLNCPGHFFVGGGFSIEMEPAILVLF